MAPPRPSHTTRQAPKNPQKHSDDDTHASDAMDIDSSEHEQPPTTSAEELIANMVEGQRKRHLSKKRKLIKAHDSTAKNVLESVEALFRGHEETASAAHDAQLKRLKKLLQKKAKLEASMENKLIALKAEYDAHSHDVQAVLGIKMREMK